MTLSESENRAFSASPASPCFDLAVIGAGSAGFSAAITAAGKGARVALVSHGTIGGTCVNVGCVPSKTMIRAAQAVHDARACGRFAGLEGHAAVTDWPALVAQKEALVTQLRQEKYIDLLSAYPEITLLTGPARLVRGGFEVDGAPHRAGKVIIATGSVPFLPEIDGLAGVPYLTSREALALEHRPGSMIVIGGGVIGCELGQMFARLGTRVTLVCRSRLLPTEEPDISTALEHYLSAEGVEVICGVSYRSVAKDGGVHLHYERDGKAYCLTAEHLLVAAGRRANTQNLGLEALGVAFGRRGGIVVDDYMQAAPGLYAAGDVTGRDLYVYMAAYGGRIAAENALGGHSLRYDARFMPRITFTDPQVASVGLTEAAARRQGQEVKTVLLPLDAVPRALAARDTRGLIKLVAAWPSGRLLGAHILAPEGADSIQTAALALRAGLTAAELGQVIFPYLTTVEGLKLAAQAFDQDVTKLSCCAG